MIDGILSPFALTERLFTDKVIDYSIPINEEKICVFVKDLNQFDSSIFSFLTLIDWIYWIQVLVWLSFMLFLIILVYIPIVFTPRLSLRNVINNFNKIFGGRLCLN